MVYCGKPSGGCSNCRRRKIRVSWPITITRILPDNVHDNLLCQGCSQLGSTLDILADM